MRRPCSSVRRIRFNGDEILFLIAQVSYKNRAHATSQETEEWLKAVLVESCSQRCFVLTLINYRDKDLMDLTQSQITVADRTRGGIYRPDW